MKKRQDNDMLYEIQKKDIPKAGVVLADAFQFDPLWNKIFEGEANLEAKFRACFETPVRFCYKYGEVYAPSDNLEGIAAYVPGSHSNMTPWRMLLSGAFLSGMRMGTHVGRKMAPVFKPLDQDRKQHMKNKEFLYLFIIGVSTAHQGKGYGGKMLRHLIEQSDSAGIPIYLETETRDNVAMYETFGFRVLKNGILPMIDQPMWELLREPR
ncbi:MAG: GNAT family N-acetyltransferase [candidate division KSB1 bacterium]|nr:GNAT family N-acetyltransferase [candidate division KSB1 bacterium]